MPIIIYRIYSVHTWYVFLNTAPRGLILICTEFTPDIPTYFVVRTDLRCNTYDATYRNVEVWPRGCPLLDCIIRSGEPHSAAARCGIVYKTLEPTTR